MGDFRNHDRLYFSQHAATSQKTQSAAQVTSSPLLLLEVDDGHSHRNGGGWRSLVSLPQIFSKFFCCFFRCGGYLPASLDLFATRKKTAHAREINGEKSSQRAPLFFSLCELSLLFVNNRAINRTILTFV